MMSNAIPTMFNGIRFRSRLEARWAIFFDLMRIDWRYEYEGYQLPSGWYVPDFWLPEIKTWVEIKPPFNYEYQSERERWEKARRLCGELAASTRKRVILCAIDFGAWLPKWNEIGDNIAAFFPPDDEDRTQEYGYDGFHLPCICAQCYQFGFEFEGRGDRICQHGISDRGHTASHHLIQSAVDQALAHNFWQGR